MIHLADQIFVLGPPYMHYMYPYEHHMCDTPSVTVVTTV
jgi:hypothetical protein